MKKLYYLIWVETLPHELHKDLTLRGYYTGMYNVNKARYVGYTKDPQYDRVVRFNSEKSAKNYIDKVLSKEQFGGEAKVVDYTFTVEPMELDVAGQEQKSSISRDDRNKAKQIFNKILSIDNVSNAFSSYCLDNNLNDTESSTLLQAVNNLYDRITKLL